MLHLTDFIAVGADGKVISRPGGRDTGDFLRGIDIDGIPVKGAKDLNGGVSLLPQVFGVPLTHPVRTGNLSAVTVLCKERLCDIWPGYEVRKDGVYCPRNTFKNVPPGNPFLVIGGGAGDGKVIAFVSIPRNS